MCDDLLCKKVFVTSVIIFYASNQYSRVCCSLLKKDHKHYNAYNHKKHEDQGAEPLRGWLLVLLRSFNLFVCIVGILDGVIHMLISSNQNFTLGLGLVWNLVTDSINVFHKVLCLIKGHLTLFDLLGMKVCFCPQSDRLFVQELLLLWHSSTRSSVSTFQIHIWWIDNSSLNLSIHFEFLVNLPFNYA